MRATAAGDPRTKSTRTVLLLARTDCWSSIRVPAKGDARDGWASATLGKEGTGIVSVAASVSGGTARIAIGCVAATPVVVSASADETAIRDAVRSADLDPPGDVHASADYRRHLAEVLAARAVREAA